jgi:hypothetical protein
MKSKNHPKCDELESIRIALKQERTPAYGDALRLARKLEEMNIRLITQHRSRLEQE